MKFYLLSDLHLEYNTYKFPQIEENSILLLPGDIGNFQNHESENNFVEFLVEACLLFKYVIHVPGNHEYFFSSIQMLPKLIEQTRLSNSFNNYFFLDRNCFTIDKKIVIIGATLWTSFDPLPSSPHNLTQQQLLMLANRSINDYKAIAFCDKNIPPNLKLTSASVQQYERRTLSPNDVLELNKRHLDYIQEKVIDYKKQGYKVIVMTHHGPSAQSITPKFKGDKLNPLFVNNLDDIILTINPNIWVHGHVHSHHDYIIGDTRVLCNARGYPKENIDDFVNGFNFTL